MVARLSRTLGNWWQGLILGTVIRTERLLLRDWQVTDWKKIYPYRSDPQVLRYLARTLPYSRKECHDVMVAAQRARYAGPRYTYDLAVVLTATNVVIGEISLIAGDVPGEAYLGFMFHRSHWGRGYATEAARAIVRFGFEKLKLTKVIAGCTPENDGSRNVLLKLGMRPLGPREGFPGAPAGVDALAFELTREEWAGEGVTSG
jgi:RimJ/RimL family protein N-acetyltransferase